MTRSKEKDQDTQPSDMERKTIKIQSQSVPGMTLPQLAEEARREFDASENKWVRLSKIIYDNDPAAHSWQEVYDLYPSIKALRAHEQAHHYYNNGDYYLARQLAEEARKETGIEIHPGAKLSDTVFIDHGMGVVIGETAIISDNVKLFHGVTLGGVGNEKGCKRHPTIQDHVEIGAGAKLLGNITIGHHSKIGANAVVLEDVPPYATAVGMPARIILHDKNWNRIGDYVI
ncbi:MULTISPECIES: serine O-acetyltransferase EpsC [Aerococcus]|uniref:serine O-acetyltransferase EpsC n=1 Tax=Aerococcus urinae (strain CCUG 59500 / ACS-120-V-Col10a) TaxID=2976812 RepID=UPI00227A9499|nr:serine O-acetyltransferase EpsC [Aerococcus sp. Group 1]MCY3031505.1 serine O-acetyltransferase [Aerococcus sp. Group 1]MCY3055760.1 serine O-acetyltransferase [Aerococcus sp. Group 1]MCY3057491.1 serine O-acetyltransferase [Aerococcus sp. Group 1]MCY3062670.1 serine O-acetyltransferase [Aerococcus sp. Group 1]